MAITSKVNLVVVQEPKFGINLAYPSHYNYMILRDRLTSLKNMEEKIKRIKLIMTIDVLNI